VAVHDNGAEPSVDPTFWDSSDVWNRQPTNTSGLPTVNDIPPGQNARTPGTNFAFVRVHRNSPAPAASPPVTVSAQFFFYNFGLGSNWQSLGSSSLTFMPSETRKELASGHAWTVPAGASGHSCLAVEISAIGDPPNPPSFAAWGAPDVRGDNNKAQRNLQVVMVSTAPDMPPGSAGNRDMRFFGLIHNPFVFSLNMLVQVQIAPEVQRRLGEIALEVVRRRAGPPIPVKQQGGVQLPLDNVRPGENLFIGLKVEVPRDADQDSMPVTFSEALRPGLGSGFTIEFRPTVFRRVFGANLDSHRAVFTRMDILFQLPGARQQARAAERAARTRPLTSAVYRRFLRDYLGRAEALVAKVVEGGGVGDPFRVMADAKRARDSLSSRDDAVVTAAHGTFMNSLDSFLTMLQLERGDVADIAQNLRWQEHLIRSLPSLGQAAEAGHVRERSVDFVRAYEAGEKGSADYPKLMEQILPDLRASLALLNRPDLGLEKELAAIEASLRSPVSLQKAHRDLLLKLEPLVP
jgi:hypothetical protein